MTKIQLPPTDVNRLHVEILEKPPLHALPRNLSDEWLNLLTRDMDACMAHNNGDGPAPDISSIEAPMLVVMHLNPAPSASTSKSARNAAFAKCCKIFHMEMDLEILRRETGVLIEPATLEQMRTGRTANIFSTTPRSPQGEPNESPQDKGTYI